MSRARRRRPPAGRLRLIAVVRSVWGLVALTSPDRVARVLGAGAHPSAARRATRVLGVRDIAQAMYVAGGSGTHRHQWGAVVDSLHVATMLALAAVSRAWRRPALTSAGISTLLLVLGRRGVVPDHGTATPERRDDPGGAGDESDEVPPGRPVFTVSPTDEPTRAQRLEAERAARDLDELRHRLDETPADPEALAQVAHDYAETVAARTRRILARSTGARSTADGLRWFGGLVLVLAGIWLLVGQWVLHYPFNLAGQNTALRDTALAVVVTLAGLRLWRLARTRDAHAQATGEDSVQVFAAPGTTSAPLRAALPPPELTDPRRRGRVAAVLALGCGVLAGASGLLLTHATWRGELNESATGVLIALAAIGFLLGGRDRAQGRSTVPRGPGSRRDLSHS